MVRFLQRPKEVCADIVVIVLGGANRDLLPVLFNFVTPIVLAMLVIRPRKARK